MKKDYSAFGYLWNIFLVLNLILSIVIIAEFFVKTKAEKAIVYQINTKDIVVKFKDLSWSSLKSFQEINDKINIRDSLLINTSPIFGYRKSYSFLSSPQIKYSNIGMNILLPIFVVIMNVIIFLLFVLTPNFLDSDSNDFNSFYDLFVDFGGHVSISTEGTLLFLLPILLNLYYWYKLWVYIIN